jgi:hypothetical protein
MIEHFGFVLPSLQLQIAQLNHPLLQELERQAVCGLRGFDHLANGWLLRRYCCA